MLVAKALKMSRFILFVSCALVMKALTTSGLLVTMHGFPLLISSALVKVLLATIRGTPQVVYHPLPILVGVLQDAASLTNEWGLLRQQPCGLMVVAIDTIKPIFVASIRRGVVLVIRAEQPVRGARGGV